MIPDLKRIREVITDLLYGEVIMAQKNSDDRMAYPLPVPIKPVPEALLNNIVALILMYHNPKFLKHRLNGFLSGLRGDLPDLFRAEG